MKRVFKTKTFWQTFTLTLIACVIFFAWELGYFSAYIPSPVRPGALPHELIFTITMSFLLALNAGLAAWQSRHGGCPLSVKSATGIAGFLGALTLICPACLLLPASIAGAGFLFAFLTPFLPLVQVISLVLLCVSLWIMRPKK